MRDKSKLVMVALALGCFGFYVGQRCAKCEPSDGIKGIGVGMKAAMGATLEMVDVAARNGGTLSDGEWETIWRRHLEKELVAVGWAKDKPGP